MENKDSLKPDKKVDVIDKGEQDRRMRIFANLLLDRLIADKHKGNLKFKEIKR